MKLLVIAISAFALSATAASLAAPRPQPGSQTEATDGALELGEPETRVSKPTEPAIRQRLPESGGGTVGLATMPVDGICYSDAVQAVPTARDECQELLKCSPGLPKCTRDKNRQEWRCKC